MFTFHLKNILFTSLVAVILLSCQNNAQQVSITGNKDSANAKHNDVSVINEEDAKFSRQPLVYDSTKTYIYLTFDDGPHAGTQECLSICKKANIKATFFMVGKHATDSWGQQTVKSIRDAYPQILLANHSYTHTNEHYKYFYSHPDMAEQDFYKAQQSLQVPYKIIRLPGNSAWVRKNELKGSKLVTPVCKKLDSAGYNVIGWDVEWNFTRGQSFPVQTPKQLLTQVNYAANGHSHTPKHVMILTHDRMFRTPAFADSLLQFINLVKSNSNYVFETVDNYPNLKF